MTILVNFLGQPSCGKTCTSARVFAKLKALDLNVEYIQEYIKGWVYEGREISKYDQFYIFGKEAHNQSKLFNKTDIIITDAPVYLTCFYHYYYNNDDSLGEACDYFYTKAKEDNIRVFNYLLPRMKDYEQKGRYQTAEQATEVSKLLQEWLDKWEFPYTYLTCPDEYRETIITTDILSRIENIERK